MRTHLTIAGGALLAAVSPAQAQTGTMNDGELEIYAEMWAMAGVCSQYHEYRVANVELAERLNAELAELPTSQQGELVRRKDAKLAAIGDHVDGLREMQRGGGRVRAVEANAEALMTRCQRLTRHDLAGDFFRRR